MEEHRLHHLKALTHSLGASRKGDDQSAVSDPDDGSTDHRHGGELQSFGPHCLGHARDFLVQNGQAGLGRDVVPAQARPASGNESGSRRGESAHCGHLAAMWPWLSGTISNRRPLSNPSPDSISRIACRWCRRRGCPALPMCFTVKHTQYRTLCSSPSQIITITRPLPENAPTLSASRGVLVFRQPSVKSVVVRLVEPRNGRPSNTG